MRTLDVLIPHFNDPLGLAVSLRSVARQTWTGRIRVVIVDDGSNTESQLAVHRIAEQSPLKPIISLNESNRGRPYTRNVLLDSIESDYVSWLDAGDEWYETKLADQFNDLDLFQSVDLEGVPTWMTCNYDWAWGGWPGKLNVQQTDEDQVKALLSGTLRAYLWTILGPARTFKDVGWFDERLTRLQDLDYFIRFALHGGVIRKTFDSKAKCLYNKSDAGRDAQAIRECNKVIFSKYRVLFNRYGPKFTRTQLYKMEMLSARYAYNNGDQSLKRQYLWQAFCLKPLRVLGHIKAKGLSVP